MDMHERDCLNLLLLDGGRPSPLWVAPFPRVGILYCISIERELSTSKHACVHVSLSLTVGLT